MSKPSLLRTYKTLFHELLEMIAKALVDHPEEVEVRSVEGQHVMVLELCFGGSSRRNPYLHLNLCEEHERKLGLIR